MEPIVTDVPRSGRQLNRAAQVEPAVGATFRIAVVGSGPKALFALESLSRRLSKRTQDEPRVQITVFDGNPSPGVGAAYSPEQPEFLRLNVTSEIVDVHEPGASGRLVPDFLGWAAVNAPHLHRETYPPRADVGRYLRTAWAVVERRMATVAEVDHVFKRVVAAEPAALTQHGRSSWTLNTADSRGYGPYHEVLLCTGHDDDHAGALSHGWRSPTPLVPAVFPVENNLGEDQVPSGSTVAVRGAALTFVDAALALTQGRGGVFIDRGQDRFTYLRAGNEPARILPVSRDGLLLDAKPVVGGVPEDVQALLVEARVRLRASSEMSQVLACVESTAVSILHQRTIRASSDAEWQISYTLRNGGPPESERLDRARRVLAMSVRAAEHPESTGPAWALGRAWAGLYPAIVENLSFREFEQREWAEFSALARAMERFAFGPPLVNARKILALVEAGVIDLSWMRAGVTIDGDGVHGPSDEDPEPDVVVDAVLAPPGVSGSQQPLYRDLLERGVLSVPSGRRGARVTESGQAVDAVGEAVAGLSLLGRATEDYVIGHDTLNRSLHPQPQRWAERVVQVLTERGATCPTDSIAAAAPTTAPAE
ncbi:amino acid decarboxylase [Kocuria soli]|uniref:Amino acid decarboxylase n=1 Tax=Kocuria soli TaxID=2485125 RepID=A0A3N3ZMG1_9MICC|nr:amino acid decarboxylase [Kocuria soli]